MSMTVNGPEAARALRQLVAEESADSERDRTLNPRTVDALWASGLMQWCNPVEAGGCEPSFPEMIDTWIELAWQDGSLVGRGLCRLPPRRRIRRGLHPTRPPGDRRRTVLPQRTG
jgi:hypothetical protein